MGKKCAALCAAFLLAAFFVSCGAKDADLASEYAFRNAGFESGTLSGWTAEGRAFSSDCVVIDDKDEDGNRFMQQGDFLFYGKRAGDAATGSMKSETFRLKGNGRIGFMIGAGKSAAKCYVALCDARSGKELAVRANDEFSQTDSPNTLHRVVLDASEHVGKDVYLKVVDNDAGVGGYNYVNVDDFIVNFQGEEDAVGKVHEAYRYVLENMSKVNGTYRHTYHLMPPIGWMNDPNGFSYAFGKVHLFYQHNPYASAWGPMHWGHATTEDFVKWQLEPIALAPDQSYDRDSGCFSGTALEKDGKMYLMYTGVSNGLQRQCMAVSDDGVTFTKLASNPVIGVPPAGSKPSDFRDPKLFVRDGTYYAIMGARSTDEMGQLVLYRSKHLTGGWEYVGTLIKSNMTNGGIFECPDLVTLNGKDFLISSPQTLATDGNRFENVHSVVYMEGKLDLATGAFRYDGALHELDSGFDFYAAQTMQAPDGRVILTAWMQMWGRTLPTAAHGWAGAMTLPRELSYRDGRLYQTPVREIAAYRKNAVSYGAREVGESLRLAGVEGTTAELEFELDLTDCAKAGVKLFKGTRHETRVYYDKAEGAVVFDRSDSGAAIAGEGKERNASVRKCDVALADGKIRFRIFLDKSSVEVFLNDGAYTMTGNVYPDAGDTGIEFFAEGGTARLTGLNKYDILV